MMLELHLSFSSLLWKLAIVLHQSWYQSWRVVVETLCVFRVFRSVASVAIEILWEWPQKISQLEAPKYHASLILFQLQRKHLFLCPLDSQWSVVICWYRGCFFSTTLSSVFSFKNRALHAFMLYICFPIGTLEIGYKAKLQLTVSMETAGSKGDYFFPLHWRFGWNTEP